MGNVVTLLRSGVRCLRSEGLLKTFLLTSNYLYRKLFGTNMPMIGVNEIKKEKIKVDRELVNIAIHPSGGMGDMFITANYVYYFSKKFCNPLVRLYIIYDGSIDSVKAVFDSNQYPMIHAYYSSYSFSDHRDEFDLIMNIARCPVFDRVDFNHLSEVMPDLLQYVVSCLKFRASRDDVITNAPKLDGSSNRLGMIENKKRMQQPDIYGLLGIKEEYEFPVRVNDRCSIEMKYGIDRDYIIVHRGRDGNQSEYCTRMWPISCYNELIRLIKEKYHGVYIIQIGISRDRCPHLSNVDVDLVGKTNIEDIKALLKNASLLIDSEGGMVHMRHALHGGTSVTFFGPSPIDYFGYPENINIVGNGCKTWCEWTLDCCFDKCLRSDSEVPPCMESITPSEVMAIIDSKIAEIQNSG